MVSFGESWRRSEKYPFVPQKRAKLHRRRSCSLFIHLYLFGT
jgi:hypothetical protein